MVKLSIPLVLHLCLSNFLAFFYVSIYFEFTICLMCTYFRCYRSHGTCTTSADSWNTLWSTWSRAFHNNRWKVVTWTYIECTDCLSVGGWLRSLTNFMFLIVTRKSYNVSFYGSLNANTQQLYDGNFEHPMVLILASTRISTYKGNIFPQHLNNVSLLLLNKFNYTIKWLWKLIHFLNI